MANKFNARTYVGNRGRNASAQMKNIMRNYIGLCNHLEGVTPEILLEALEPTFELSLDYVPKDTGELAKSGYLEITSSRGKPMVEIGYGKGGEPSYAVSVHENLEWHHKAPTRAKWLQVALAEDEANIQRRIVQGYQGVFG